MVLLLFVRPSRNFIFFFFNDTATTEIYTLSLHDALPISDQIAKLDVREGDTVFVEKGGEIIPKITGVDLSKREKRSEEHTSELQSQSNLVCRLLLEKKKNKTRDTQSSDTHYSTRVTRQST